LICPPIASTLDEEPLDDFDAIGQRLTASGSTRLAGIAREGGYGSAVR